MRRRAGGRVAPDAAVPTLRRSLAIAKPTTTNVA